MTEHRVVELRSVEENLEVWRQRVEEKLEYAWALIAERSRPRLVEEAEGGT
jgi:hypothetical protein